jgi:hypothetical protein
LCFTDRLSKLNKNLSIIVLINEISLDFVKTVISRPHKKRSIPVFKWRFARTHSNYHHHENKDYACAIKSYIRFGMAVYFPYTVISQLILRSTTNISSEGQVIQICGIVICPGGSHE